MCGDRHEYLDSIQHLDDAEIISVPLMNPYLQIVCADQTELGILLDPSEYDEEILFRRIHARCSVNLLDAQLLNLGIIFEQGEDGISHGQSPNNSLKIPLMDNIT